MLRDIHLTFGGHPLLEGAELMVAEGERICVVGRNGSGKSTLLKIAAGMIDPDAGEVFVQPGATVRYLPQEPDLSGFTSVLAYVEAGLAPGDDLFRAQYLLNELGLSGGEAPERLSGGEARRAALARVLAPQPDILLLDEPTNHLDLPAIEWLEGELKVTRAALVLISHDRRFLEQLSQATLWLDRGTARRLEKGFEHFEAWRDEILESEATDRHKLDRKLAMEADWLRYGVTARRKRNMGRLRALQDLRKQRREQRKATGSVRMAAAEAEQSGKIVAEAKSISKSFGDLAVVREFSTRIQRGDKVGIIGPNGAGKTTLLNLLTGALAPDSGTIRIGVNLEAVSLDQKRESLNPSWTLADALTGDRGDIVHTGTGTRHVVSYMKDFLFTPNQARQPISALSGGERGRLMLARALAKPSNLLILDEPTNDLDLETLDLLQELLGDYRGTVLLVSHDRDFLDRVVTSVIASEGNGRWVEYAGGYSDMVAQRGRGVEVNGKARPSRDKVKEPRQIPSPAAKPQAKRKLSFKEKHALETLPGRMTELEAEITALRETLADSGFYGRDPEAFETAAAKLEAREAAFAEAEERWLALEILREDLEGD